MRIVLVTRRYRPAIGGVERVTEELAVELRGEHEVSVVAQRVDAGPHGRFTHVLREAPRFRAFDHRGVGVRQLRLSRSRRALLLPLAHEAVPLVARFARRRGRAWTARLYARAAAPALTPLLADADVVHVLGGDWLSAAVVDWCRERGVPVVVSPFAHPGAWGDDAASVRSYRRADRVLATLESDAANLRAMGVQQSSIEICGVPCPGLESDGTRFAQDGVPPDAPLAVFVGERRPAKGADVFVDALRLVWQRQPELHAALVGPGPPPAIADPRLHDAGAVSDGERAAWVQRASLLALPSAGESFGIVVPEAWSVGTPVVVSDIPVLRELVDGAGGGIVAERTPAAVAAAMLELLEDPARARALGERGRERWSERYTPAVVAARHAELYERLSRARSPRAAPAPAGARSR